MKNYSYHLCILFLITIVVACQQSQDFVLKEQESYTIITPPDTSSLMIKAGEVLKRSLEKRINGSFDIVRRGDAPEAKIELRYSEEPNGEHTIQYFVENEKLIIQGGSPRSVLNAVYTFLEDEIGYRFYSPNAEFTPKEQGIRVSKQLNYTYTPPITTRTVHSRLFYQNHAFADARKVTYEAFPKYAPSARVHTFNHFIPADQFFNDHPEYYALRDGKRRTTQLCLTNEKVYEIVRDSVDALMVKYPDANVISVSQDDNTQYCQCTQCELIHKEEGSAAGSMIYFVNRIARAFPDIQISTLAYQYTRKAPLNMKPEKNVLITLCSIECDRSAPIEKKCKDFLTDLIEWGKITNNIRIWDYTTQFTNFLAPFPNLFTLQPNIQLFRDNNAKWVFEQHSHHPSELFELRSYLTSKLLWNPDLDIDAEMEDFLNGYYGQAGPFVKEYIEDVHRGIKNDSTFFLFLYGDPSQAFNSFLNIEALKAYDQLFNAGAERVKKSAELTQRVNAARLSIDYAILEHAKTNLQKNVENPFYQVDQRLQRFKETCAQNDITLMNEMRYSVSEYMDLYKNTMQRAGQKNAALGKKVVLTTSPKKYANEDPQTLTDGAFGGASFYSNWLGFEGNDLEAVIDLGEAIEISEISAAFLQVTNHIVFFPDQVLFMISSDGNTFQNFGEIENKRPLNPKSKVNDIQEYNLKVSSPALSRYVKLKGINKKKAPDWHNAAGLPAWIFIDEVQIK